MYYTSIYGKEIDLFVCSFAEKQKVITVTHYYFER